MSKPKSKTDADVEIVKDFPYERLVPFFIEQGLEFDPEEENEAVPTDIVRTFAAIRPSDGATTPEQKHNPNARSASVFATAPKRRGDLRSPANYQCGLLGGVVLARREGEFIIDGIAVAPERRKDGLGAKLLELAEEEARASGARRLFLVARAPRFFAKQGYEQVLRDDAPLFFECFTCPQYKKTCFPEVMRRLL